jgi:hypothetical protein
MSASGSGVPSASSLFEQARGRSLTSIAKTGLGSWVLAVVAAGVAGLQSFLQLLLVPIDLMVQLANASIAAFFLEPFGIVTSGASATGEAVEQFGIFGLLVAVVMVLATIYIIAQFLEREDTTDVPIPGFIVDPPLPGIGVDEQEEED